MNDTVEQQPVVPHPSPPPPRPGVIRYVVTGAIIGLLVPSIFWFVQTLLTRSSSYYFEYGATRFISFWAPLGWGFLNTIAGTHLVYALLGALAGWLTVSFRRGRRSAPIAVLVILALLFIGGWQIVRAAGTGMHPWVCGFFGSAGNQQEKCYRHAAWSQGDVELCRKLGEEQDFELCVIGVATEQGDMGMCAAIENENVRRSCEVRVGQESGDITICAGLELSRDAGSCYAHFADDGVNPCPDLGDPNERIRCALSVIRFINDESICAALGAADREPETNRPARDACYSGIAFYHRSPSACEKMDSRDLREQCFATAGEALDDTSLCDRSGIQRDLCYQDIAIDNSEPQLCLKIVNVQTRDICYDALARKDSDVSLCDRISQSTLRNSCLNRVSQ